MKLIKRIADAVNSRTGSLVFFALSAAAFTFFLQQQLGIRLDG